MSAGLQILHTDACVKGIAPRWANDNRETDFDALAFIDNALCQNSRGTIQNLEP
jgi:hypothetical protein